MNEYITKWIAALRSNKYNKGQWQLRSNSQHHCVLGVLCDVVHPDGWEIRKGSDYKARPYWMFTYGKQSDGLIVPDELRQKVGLTSQLMHKLSDMNDVLNRSLKVMADYIEVQYESGNKDKVDSSTTK